MNTPSIAVRLLRLVERGAALADRYGCEDLADWRAACDRLGHAVPAAAEPAAVAALEADLDRNRELLAELRRRLDGVSVEAPATRPSGPSSAARLARMRSCVASAKRLLATLSPAPAAPRAAPRLDAPAAEVVSVEVAPVAVSLVAEVDAPSAEQGVAVSPTAPSPRANVRSAPRIAAGVRRRSGPSRVRSAAHATPPELAPTVPLARVAACDRPVTHLSDGIADGRARAPP